MAGMVTALRVIAACIVAGLLGYWRMTDPIAPTFQEKALVVAIGFFGTLWLTGAFSSRGKSAS